MLSHLELRHIIEAALLPRFSTCGIGPDGSMTIQLLSPNTRQVELTVAGINLGALPSSRAIAKLVAEIKEEARMSCVSPVKMTRHL